MISLCIATLLSLAALGDDPSVKQVELKKGDRIIFFGDSLTALAVKDKNVPDGKGYVPLLRDALSEELVASFARKNGVLAAVPWLRGADLPVLALNQLRLVLRLAQAYGAADDPPERLPELAAIVGAGFGLRALVRELRGLSPGAGWALRAAIAYSGTRAVGEAARLRFALAATPRPAGAARAAP